MREKQILNQRQHYNKTLWRFIGTLKELAISLKQRHTITEGPRVASVCLLLLLCAFPNLLPAPTSPRDTVGARAWSYIEF